MLALILFIAFGLIFGYFATLNTSSVTVHFGWSSLEYIPLYLLVLSSLALGVLFSGLFYFFKSLPHWFSKNKVKQEVADLKDENTNLLKKIHQLELENTRLKTQTGEVTDDDDSL